MLQPEHPQSDVMLLSPELASRAEVAFGLQVHHALHGYQLNAVLPSRNWEPAPAGFFCAAGKESAAHNTVAVFRAPHKILTCVRRALEIVSPSVTGADLRPEPFYKIALQELQKFLRTIEDPLPLRSTFVDGVQFRAPARVTVSKNDQTGEYVGMHVDTWDLAQRHDRSRSRNRIAINVSTEPRSFLYVPITFEALRRSLDDNPDYDLAPHELVLAVAKAFPTCPVVRLRVDPGEAYLAPTENIIHDASTERVVRLDVTIHARGYFCPELLRAHIVV